MWYTQPLYELFVFAFLSHPLLGHSLISTFKSMHAVDLQFSKPNAPLVGRDGFLCMNLGGSGGLTDRNDA